MPELSVSSTKCGGPRTSCDGRAPSVAFVTAKATALATIAATSTLTARLFRPPRSRLVIWSKGKVLAYRASWYGRRGRRRKGRDLPHASIRSGACRRDHPRHGGV